MIDFRIVNAMAEDAYRSIIDAAQEAVDEEIDQLFMAYMTILLIKANIDSVVDAELENATEFKFECLDILNTEVTEE